MGAVSSVHWGDQQQPEKLACRRKCRIQANNRRWLSCFSHFRFLLHRRQKMVHAAWRERDIKPTRSGLALRLREWDDMKIVERVNDKYPSVGTALPCYMSDDHLNQMRALQCRDCYPFMEDILWTFRQTLCVRVETLNWCCVLTQTIRCCVWNKRHFFLTTTCFYWRLHT